MAFLVEIFESARIDGASELLVLRKIDVTAGEADHCCFGFSPLSMSGGTLSGKGLSCRRRTNGRSPLPSGTIPWVIKGCLPQNVQLAAMLISTLPR